ncbi:hypothetical protein [Sediminibacterium soli]|uniref:hypothetical protein n=1 Tax=Sediminibacterium soli TaxID=2698829 RepID=UPI0013796D0B|nr:hypothetical protein [Sediminibacterium soli]NCI45783.1 hypothetical protein [Sediminibacterium soli]
MRKLLVLLLLIFIGSSNSVTAQCPDPQVPSFIAHAEVALKGVNVNANVQAGIWTRFGGLAAGFVSHSVPYKEDAKNSYAALAPGYKQVITPVGTLSGRIVLAYKYLISPYITAGNDYTEKGVKLGVLTENDMAIGIKASDQGFGICLAKIF